MTTAASSDPRRYVQLAATIRRQISDGTLAKDTSLPSIRMLCTEYQLSRQTAGKSLRILADEGLIHRVPGLGYHVS